MDQIQKDQTAIHIGRLKRSMRCRGALPSPFLCCVQSCAPILQIHPAKKHGGEVVEEERLPRSAEQHEVGSEREAEEKNPFKRILAGL